MALERWVGFKNGKAVEIFDSRWSAESALVAYRVDGTSPINETWNTDLLDKPVGPIKEGN